MSEQQRQLIVHEQAKSPIAEAFRTLRTNIQYSKVDGDLRTIMITSAGPGEGKSTISANTAVAMAQSGKKVIIIDCDLRKPVQHKIFEKRNRGLTNVLVEEIPCQDVIQETEVENLWVMTSGPIPPNPSELLGSSRMNDVMAELKKEYDFMVFDAPPVVAVTDACVLASRMDGVALVVSAGIARPEMAQHARDLLIRANGRLLGVIMNRVEIQEEYSYYYYYYGSDKKASR